MAISLCLMIFEMLMRRESEQYRNQINFSFNRCKASRIDNILQTWPDDNDLFSSKCYRKFCSSDARPMLVIPKKKIKNHFIRDGPNR